MAIVNVCIVVVKRHVFFLLFLLQTCVLCITPRGRAVTHKSNCY
jgi:hypothetical protein